MAVSLPKAVFNPDIQKSGSLRIENLHADQLFSWTRFPASQNPSFSHTSQIPSEVLQFQSANLSH
jgi:hypothetical protein